MDNKPTDPAEALQAALQHAAAALAAKPDELVEASGALHALLAERLGELLVHDRRRLLQILYRVDVDERRVRQALRRPLAEARRTLATLLLERLQRTAEARLRYAQRRGP